MIISHEHNFVFVQVPTTGSTFLGRFFEQEFGGELILDKHSTYTDFLEIATQEQASYRSIIGKRHPLDMLTTRFARRIKRSGVRHASIEETQADFERWLWEKFIRQKHKRLNPHIKHSPQGTRQWRREAHNPLSRGHWTSTRQRAPAPASSTER